MDLKESTYMMTLFIKDYVEFYNHRALRILNRILQTGWVVPIPYQFLSVFLIKNIYYRQFRYHLNHRRGLIKSLYSRGIVFI